MLRPFAVLLVSAALPAHAQSDLIETARNAYAAAWALAPLSIGTTAFVTRPPQLIGDIVERQDARFAPGEEILIYAEPWGYDYIQTIDGYEFGFDLDMEVLDRTGAVVFAQDGFQSIRLSSRHEVREFVMLVALDFDGFDPGPYTVRLQANDIASDQSSTFSMAFVLTP
ncbi:MAG: hypothetical protein AAGA32_08460 [Pseudomonadota bacterium]